ncbi:MAG TPA: outer membrane protein transport protein, partial [Planctomycetaceae bacterium]
EDRFTLEGDVTATVFGLAPVPVTSDFDAEVDLVWPQSVGVGIKHELSDRHRVGADVIWYDWSHAFDRLDMRLTNPSHPAFQALAPTISDSFPLEWEDSVSVRTGYEFLYTPKDIFRLGYVFNSDTVPNRTLTPYIPAILDHTVSTGYTRLWRDFRFNWAYQYAFGSDRHVSDSGIVGGDFDSSRFDSDAHWVYFSVAREF